MLNADDCVLLIIDIQDKLSKAAYNSVRLENRASILTKASNILQIPVFITEQYPKGLGKTVSSIKSSADNCTIMEKTYFDAFADKNIYEKFEKLGKSQVLICGIETHICVYQTAYHLLEEGYEVTLVSDACGSRNEFEHMTAIDNLKLIDNCDIKSTEMVLFELLKTSKHPDFKEIQALIK